MTDDPVGGPPAPEERAGLFGRRVNPSVIFLFLAVYLLWRVRDILPPFLIALFLAALLDPIVTRFQARGIPRIRVVIALFLAVLVLTVGLLTLIVPALISQVSDLAANVGDYATRATEAAQRVTEQADRWYADREKTLLSLGLREKPSEYLQQQTGLVSGAVRNFLDGVRQTLANLLGHVLWLIIIPVSLFYFLLDYPTIRRRTIGLLPVSKQEDADHLVQTVIEILGAYIRGLVKVCILYGVTAILLFWILRLNYALFLGIAAGVFYAVPYLGPALTVASIVILTITMGKTAGFVVLVVALFLAMHITYDYGITPRVVGGSVGLHPLVNIFALMCGVTLFGVWGMILAVPIAASVQRILIHFYPRLGVTAAESSADAATSSS